MSSVDAGGPRLVAGSLSGSGLVYWVTLNRPEKLNALNREMWSQLAEEIARGCSSPARLVALRGEGRAFCAGDDIKAMYDLSSPEEARGFFDTLLRAVEALVECSKPVAAVVHGYAYGGCAEILLFMDYVVGVEGSRVAAPEVHLGLIPPMLSSAGPLLLGRRARWVALSGEPLTIEEAREIGLVDEVAGSLEEAIALVERRAEALTRAAEEAVAVTRRILYRPALEAVKASGAFEELARLSLTPQAKARMNDFLQRRRRS